MTTAVLCSKCPYCCSADKCHPFLTLSRISFFQPSNVYQADIQYWDDTLTEELENIQTLLERARNQTNAMERASILERAEKKLRSANGTKRSFKMECRLVSDPNQRRRYENQLARHEEDWKALSSDLKALKAEGQRGQLFVGANKGGGEISPEATGDYMLEETNRLQDRTKESLGRTKQMVAESKETGMATLEELERQRGQIENIDREAMRIEDSLARADKLIKTFGRRMATDKFIQCCACFNVLLVVGVILYSTLRGGSLSGSRATGDPESPVRHLVSMFLRGSGGRMDAMDGGGD